MKVGFVNDNVPKFTEFTQCTVYVFYEPWLSSVSVSEPGENSTREVGGDGDGKSSASDQV